MQKNDEVRCAEVLAAQPGPRDLHHILVQPMQAEPDRDEGEALLDKSATRRRPFRKPRKVRIQKFTAAGLLGTERGRHTNLKIIINSLPACAALAQA